MHGGERYVFNNAHVVEKVELLEYHSDVSALDVNIHFQVAKIVAFEKNVTVGRVFKNVKTAQKRGFAAARRAYYRHFFALINFIRNVV